MVGNPYAMTGRATYDGPTELNHDDMGPNADYAMPEIGQGPYGWEGYADKTDGALRTGQIKEHGYNLTGKPDGDPGAIDWEKRHADEEHDSPNEPRVQGYSKEFDLSAYRNPPVAVRPTQLIGQNNYGFNRPLDVGTRGEMHLTGQRYSLAEFATDQNRVGGQAPFRPLRNTYRVDAGPWDQGLTDVPDPSVGYAGDAGIGGFSGGSYRL